MTSSRSFSALLSLLLALSVGATSVFAASDNEKRAKIREMRDQTLAELYAAKPGTKDSIRRAAGYAVFSNVSVSFGLSAGGGRGIIVDEHGKETFMKMGMGGIGLAVGVKDFRVVIIFYSKEKLHDFIANGWDFSGQADAAAKSDDKGGAASGATNIGDGVELFQFTKNGLALEATLNGTKYWKDEDLNKP